MARFYDSIDNSDLGRVERLLKKEGIAYSLQILGSGSAVKEILVAEEDLSAAERALFDQSEVDGKKREYH